MYIGFSTVHKYTQDSGIHWGLGTYPLQIRGGPLYHILLIHSSVGGRMGCFFVLALVNSAVVNVGVQLSPHYSTGNVATTLQ